MLVSSIRRFIDDEDGGYTLWSVFWFMVYLFIGGLAVDVTNAYRNEALLQSTADASALAGVMSLPDTDNAVAQALAYASDNMAASVNGNVLKPAEVFTGNWDGDQFTNNGTPLNAVAVITRRDYWNANPVATNFLRIVGLAQWDIATSAIAVKYTPGCGDDGLISAQEVSITSGNHFINNFCIHGQQGVKISSNNIFDPGVHVSMGSLDNLQIPASGYDSNDGLADALTEGDLSPAEVYKLPAIIEGLLDLNPAYLPDYIDTVDGDGNALDVIEVGSKYNFADYEEHRVYHVICSPQKNMGLPSGVTIQNIVIVSDCVISGGSGALLQNVVLATSSIGNGQDPLSQQSVSLAANIVLGAEDGCNPDNGVRIYSEASVHTSSGTMLNGVQIVAAGDVDLTAANDGILGVSVQAGGDITMTANNIMGFCTGGTDTLLTGDWYRLVR